MPHRGFILVLLILERLLPLSFGLSLHDIIVRGILLVHRLSLLSVYQRPLWLSLRSLPWLLSLISILKIHLRWINIFYLVFPSWCLVFKQRIFLRYYRVFIFFRCWRLERFLGLHAVLSALGWTLLAIRVFTNLYLNRLLRLYRGLFLYQCRSCWLNRHFQN